MSEKNRVPLYQKESFLPEFCTVFRKNKQMSFVDAAESVSNSHKRVVFLFGARNDAGRMTPQFWILRIPQSSQSSRQIQTILEENHKKLSSILIYHSSNNSSTMIVLSLKIEIECHCLGEILGGYADCSLRLFVHNKLEHPPYLFRKNRCVIIKSGCCTSQFPICSDLSRAQNESAQNLEMMTNQADLDDVLYLSSVYSLLSDLIKLAMRKTLIV